MKFNVMNSLSSFYTPFIGLMIAFWSYAIGAAPMLESPASIGLFNPPSPTIQQLSAMLQDNQLKSFYQGTKKHTLTFSVTTRDNVDTELRDKIWLSYLVASAPFFSYQTWKEIEPDVFVADDMVDIHLKSELCLLLEKYIRLVHGTKRIKEPLKTQILTCLMLPYYARILKQFKNAHEPNPAQADRKENPALSVAYKDEELRHLPIKEILKLVHEGVSHHSFIKTRNEVYKDEVKDMEKYFMEILVRVFPGKYSKVEEFLLQAGYSKQEIPDLIDRTVGRDNTTDFLYKGKHRISHERLLKKKK